MSRLLVLILLCGVCGGCVSLSRTEREQFREIRELGLPTDAERVKSPILAGVLNVLPGIGNFYLAAGTDESAQWVFGMLNLVTWPFSVLWGVPEAAIDAGTINKKETVSYYRFNPRGKAALDGARSSPGL